MAPIIHLEKVETAITLIDRNGLPVCETPQCCCAHKEMKMKLFGMTLALVAMPMMTAMAADPFAEVNAKMHKEMMVAPTGNIDIDYVRGMIPHHEGAVEMAKIQMQQGSDPAIKQLSAEIIKSQEKEIQFMKNWLKNHASDRIQMPATPSDTGMGKPKIHGGLGSRIRSDLAIDTRQVDQADHSKMDHSAHQ